MRFNLNILDRLKRSQIDSLIVAIVLKGWHVTRMLHLAFDLETLPKASIQPFTFETCVLTAQGAGPVQIPQFLWRVKARYIIAL